METNKGFSYGNSYITGVIFTYQDGSKEFVKADLPILYKTKGELE